MLSIKKLAPAVLIGVITLFFPPVWAADTPIGALKASGQATITAQGSSIRLNNENYAYFSGDKVRTAEGSRAVILLDGMNVIFTESTGGRVSIADGIYEIDITEGRMTLDAGESIAYRVFSNGAPISSETEPLPGGQPVLLTADSNGGEAQLYIPAQLSQDQIDALQASGAFSAEEIEALKGATQNISQQELANMTEEDLRALLPPPGTKGGLTTGAKVGIAAGIIALGAVVISNNDDDDVAVAPPPPKPPTPSPPPPPLPPPAPPPASSGGDDNGSGS